MSNLLSGHLVGFEAMPDLEGAIPSCFEEEFTDIYGAELLPQRIGDGSESYDEEIERHQKRRPRKISSQAHAVVLSLPIHER